MNLNLAFVVTLSFVVCVVSLKMTNNQKITNIINVLNRLYPYPPVPLNSRNNFTFLCAVVLSAQTTDGKVNDVTKKLFELASNPQDMSKLSVDVVEQIIKPVGLAPRKASYLVDLSKMIVNQFEGVVPCSYEDLEKLPGVGHKTASVIMSQAFGEPSIAVDTHVHRLALRWGLTKEKSNPDKVQKDLCDLFPREYWNRLHLQMIYFGREYCTAKNHDVRIIYSSVLYLAIIVINRALFSLLTEFILPNMLLDSSCKWGTA